MTTPPAGLIRSSPVLMVRDVKAAAEAYAEKLGFEVLGYWGEPAGFSIVRRGPVTLMLATPWTGDAFRPNAAFGRPDAYIYCEDVDALHAELVQRGAEVICAPEDQPHGCREITVRDLDGHEIIFGQDLA